MHNRKPFDIMPHKINTQTINSEKEKETSFVLP